MVKVWPIGLKDAGSYFSHGFSFSGFMYLCSTVGHAEWGLCMVSATSLVRLS